MNPIILFVFFLADFPCGQIIPGFFTQFPCGRNHRVILAVLRDHSNRFSYDLLHAALAEGHGAHDGVEDLAQNAVVVVGNDAVSEGQPGRPAGVRRRAHAADCAAHLGADPFAERVGAVSAFRRINAEHDVFQGDVLRRPAGRDQGGPFLRDVGRSNLITFLRKGFQKCDFIGDVVIVGVRLPHIAVNFPERFFDVPGIVAFDRGADCGADDLRDPARVDLPVKFIRFHVVSRIAAERHGGSILLEAVVDPVIPVGMAADWFCFVQ